jgi:hypothetical protein
MYWLLIAVLSSTIPLSPEVAQRLYQAAYRLHHAGESVEKIHGDLFEGRVVRLQKDMLLGSVAGPAFEAEIATERGDGTVRFLLTRQGLGEDEDDGREALGRPAAPPRLMN